MISHLQRKLPKKRKKNKVTSGVDLIGAKIIKKEMHFIGHFSASMHFDRVILELYTYLILNYWKVFSLLVYL